MLRAGAMGHCAPARTFRAITARQRAVFLCAQARIDPARRRANFQQLVDVRAVVTSAAALDEFYDSCMSQNKRQPADVANGLSSLVSKPAVAARRDEARQLIRINLRQHLDQDRRSRRWQLR